MSMGYQFFLIRLAVEEAERKRQQAEKSKKHQKLTKNNSNMIFNYQRGNLSLMVDIDKIDYINCQQVDGKVPIKYYIEIGMSTGRSIDLTVSYSEHYDLMKVLNKFMQQRADFMSAENPFLDKEIDGLVSALAMKACEQLGVRTLGDLVKHNRQEILAIEHIGKKTLTELDELLEEHLLYWGYKVQ